MTEREPALDARIEEVRRIADRLVRNIEQVLVGKREAIEETVCTLFCGGHLLAEDVPGVGKTMLARALARSLGLTFRRIQFTPDLLPSDVIGVTVYNQATAEFQFKPGPIFAQVVLADEINRGTPRTQSALLECMEELQVSVDGVNYPFARPFVVIATQNPVEFEGTFPLPEAQLDRFFARITLGYPDEASEVAMLDRLRGDHPIERVEQVVSAEEVLRAQRIVRDVHVARPVAVYIVRLVRRTREHADVALGASPRGSLALYRAAQARAALAGRSYVLPDDVKRMAAPILGHRLILRPEAAMRGATAQQVILDVLETVPLELRDGASGDSRPGVPAGGQPAEHHGEGAGGNGATGR